MPDRRTFLTLAMGLPAWGLMGRMATAATPDVFNTDGLAIHGYDMVGYFTEGKPLDGQEQFSVKWRGAMWRFANSENMEAFEMNPRSYAPQYGGYCAYAMSKGAIATSVPEAWTIHEGKLYLNFSKGVRRSWRKDMPGYVAAADGYWPGILES